jgi:hypothetical protein
MSKIKIEKKPFAETLFYAGTYACDMSEDENVASIKDFEFTVVLNIDNNNDFYDVSDISWTDGEPRDVEIATEKIREYFNELVLQ